MAITNYTELQSAVIDWAHRPGDTAFAARVPDFISLAETRIARTFVPRGVEIEVELLMTPGSRFVALPADFDNPIALWLKAWLPRQQLMQRPPDQLPVTENVSGYPQYWSIDGENIAFDLLAESAFPFEFRYTQTFALSDANTTNYTLTNFPNLYLFGALVESCGYTMEDARLPLWEQRYQQAMKDAKEDENKNRSLAPLVTELASIQRSARFNITRGY
jgi:hypothetical protein